MNLLSEKQLNNISAGGISRAVLAGLAAAGIFIVGVVDGFIRPLKCHR